MSHRQVKIFVLHVYIIVFINTFVSRIYEKLSKTLRKRQHNRKTGGERNIVQPHLKSENYKVKQE